MRPTPQLSVKTWGGGGVTTTGPDATHPPNYLSKLGRGGTTTGPDATHPPTICQNLGGGGLQPVLMRPTTQLSVKTWGGGGGVTTTGPDATHPPTICQNLGGGDYNRS